MGALGVVALAVMPGRIARKQGHPQADAINICGWFGALTLGFLAPVAFIWAYTRPVMRPSELGPPATPVKAEGELEREGGS